LLFLGTRRRALGLLDGASGEGGISGNVVGIEPHELSGPTLMDGMLAFGSDEETPEADGVAAMSRMDGSWLALAAGGEEPSSE
jgi:hypothetical protein